MEVNQLVRKFKHNDVLLSDPNPKFTVRKVLNYYSQEYPELVNATISNPEVNENEIVYSFESRIGTKG